MAIEKYPARFELDAPLEVANWRPLVQWLLAIPHLFIVNVLSAVANVLAFVSFFAVLFTQRIPDGIVGFQAMVLRYQYRVLTYVHFMREDYPPFSFETVELDDGIDQTRLSIENPGEMNRWLPLVKWLMLIPHIIVVVVLAIGAVFVGIVAFFAVLFTGKFPEGMRNYILGVARWALRINFYGMFLTDEYPPFSLDQSPPLGGGQAPGAGGTPPPPPPAAPTTPPAPPPPTAPPA